MMGTNTSLIWGLIFGSIGFAYFLYGKKQQKIAPFACGLTLIIFPYFVANTTALVLIGVALVVAPYFYR